MCVSVHVRFIINVSERVCLQECVLLLALRHKLLHTFVPVVHSHIPNGLKEF